MKFMHCPPPIGDWMRTVRGLPLSGVMDGVSDIVPDEDAVSDGVAVTVGDGVNDDDEDSVSELDTDAPPVSDADDDAVTDGLLEPDGVLRDDSDVLGVYDGVTLDDSELERVAVLVGVDVPVDVVDGDGGTSTTGCVCTRPLVRLFCPTSALKPL